MTALDQLRIFGIQPWGEAAEMAKDQKMWKEQEKNMLAQYSTRNPATQVKSKTFSPLIVRDTNLCIEQ